MFGHGPAATVKARKEEDELATEGIRGSVCKLCGSPDLIARDTAIGYADGTVRIYLDCAAIEGHDAEAVLQFYAREARQLLESTSPAPPTRRKRVGTSPRT